MSRNPFNDESPLFDTRPGDEPLFLEPNSRDRMIENVIGAGVFAFVALTFVFSIINGFGKSGNHFFLGLTLAGFTFVTVQLIRWYRLGELDTKYKLLILVLGASLLLLAVVANVYFWSAGVDQGLVQCHGDPDPDKHGKLGFYQGETRTCWLICDDKYALNSHVAAPGACVSIPS
ncbi:hypothetical protein DFS34DRAFT_623765 [Phlyctochytrium arcticum]|nr:hypothetical protein DFS34DRAFT_623765 [Phlyctochytrium arcticum]